MHETAGQSDSRSLDKKNKRGRHAYPRELPADGFARLETVLAVFPVSRSTWYQGIKDGRYPDGIKLGPRVTAWRVQDVRALLERSAVLKA